MKKILSIFLAVGLVFVFSSQFVQAQSIKKYSGKKSVSLPGGIYRSIDCQENYDYYIGDDGSYVKSGNYTLKGAANQIKGTVNASYSVTATYKNGLLNGHLSAKVTVKGRGDYNYTFHSYDQYNVEYTLSANFKDGIPDGQWIYSETGMLEEDKSIHKTTFNCKNGVFVGDFVCNFSSMKFPASQKGKFDQDGKLLSIIIQGGGSGSKAGVGVGNVGMKEYNLNSNGDLVSYFLRDEGKTVEKYQYDETLLKEYDEQDQSSLLTFIKEKGYYLTREASKKTITYSSYTFGTLTILDYIWQKLVLNKSIDGVKLSNGFFSTYPYNVCEIQKIPVKPLTEKQLSELLGNIERNLNYEYSGYNESLSKESVYAQCKKDYHINRNQTVDLIKISDTLRYFDDSQLDFFKESVYRLWGEALGNKRREREQKIQEAKNEVSNNAKATITEIMDEVVSWPMDAYEEQYFTQDLVSTQVKHPRGTTLEIYYRDHRTRIWDEYFGHRSDAVTTAMKKFEKFHKVVSYNIDDIRITDNFDTCWVHLTMNKKNKDSYGYQTYRTNALFLCSRRAGYMYHNLDTQHSFEKCERIYNIWDTINFLVDSSTLLKKQLQSAKKSFKNVYESYSKSVNPLNGDKENPQVQYDYWQNTISNQRNYLKFIELTIKIDDISNEIALKAKEEKDVYKSYQEVRKTWSLDVLGNIVDEVKRLESYRAIQDSCMTFIELRKTITQNNAKIASFSKTAPTIVKAYFTFMKGVDLTWNQEAGRNQAVREIIRTQDALLKALSQPNISEIDKTVKKSKAKSWEDVKKIVLLH